ncbi:fibrillin-2-like [Anneissia japonica]|uniref:fibrillin-2-like n=1 Tax=Anneissia japonica TaxID=1529436 RepID=UPI0014257D15|nr:fibrillin-2-like [Anneissia japonica]
MTIISNFVFLVTVVCCVQALNEYSPYCTERLYAGSGVIKSPGFPGKYESDMKCSWLIHTDNSNRITLDFTSFDVEAASDCYYDYVEVFDGSSNNDRSLGKFCGPETPRDLTASGNMLFVEFKTDSSVEKGGFSANFSEGCSWTFNGLEGDFHSPNYPNNYMDGIQCTYKFNAPPGKRIKISFTDFKLEGKSPNSRCAYDYLEILDGESRDSDSLGRKCGRELPPDILSTTNRLFIKLTTDNSVNYGGFNGHFEAINAGPSPCDTNNGGCEHNCRPSGDNQPDCFCRDGFVLDIDGKSCNDIDECRQSEPCEQICRNYEGTYGCFCLPGYVMNQNGLCKDVNECQSDNGGCEEDCTNIRGSFKCSCSSPNKVLQDDRLSCAEAEPSPCDIGNGGCQQYCRLTVDNQAECYCRDGFRLQNDQQSCHDINECQQGLNPCGQLCFNTEGSFICSCQLGYKLMENGLQCKDINECHINNGGCEEDCVNIRGSYRCHCSTHNRVLNEDKQTCRETVHLGFELKEDGKGCQDINECSRKSSPFDIHSNQCNQLCINTPGSYYCDCEKGFELSPNARVCKEIDECATQLRLTCDQDCVNFPGGYRCQCFDGYSQEEDGCQDINECEPKPEDCHTCTNLPGSFTCQCNPGFVPNENQTSCLDINECMINNGGCQHVCANSLGGHNCRCRAGYQGTDRTNRVCVDINECQNSDDDKGPCNHHCLNSRGSFECICEEGYYLNDDGVTCLDIDECLDDNGDCSQKCINTPGSYSCQCFPGYEVTEDKTECIDINECATNRNGCDVSENAFCINTEGNYTCGCPLGYENFQWLHCQDFDECSNPRTHNCEQICNNTVGRFRWESAVRGGQHIFAVWFLVLRFGYATCNVANIICLPDIDECQQDICDHNELCLNTAGSFTCFCRSGYFLMSDRLSCSDINECADNNGGCEHKCINDKGGHRCECFTGFELEGDGKGCRDTNECLIGAACCNQMDNCVNLEGGYTCSCSHGYYISADNCTCVDIDECDMSNTHCDHLCTNTPGSFHCACNEGYVVDENDATKCQDIDECLLESTDCQHECINFGGGFNCSCRDNFKLMGDGQTCQPCPTCDDFENLKNTLEDMGNFIKSLEKVVLEQKKKSRRLEERIKELEDWKSEITENNDPSVDLPEVIDRPNIQRSIKARKSVS